MTDLNFVKDLQHRRLWETDWISSSFDFWKLEDQEIPQKPGVYILLAKGTHFQYPRGKNSVFYIGQSANLRRRLRDHLKFATEAKYDRQYLLYWPRYEYCAAFGTHYCYVRTWQGLKPKALEDVVMANFAKKHGSFPVANSAGAWNRIQHILGSEE